MIRAFAAALLAAPTAHAAEPAKAGDKAPDVTLEATANPLDKDAKTLNVKDFAGKKAVVLFYFPKAMTKGCTIESCGFSKIVEKFAAEDAVVIGFSPDPLKMEQEFTEKEKLNFPLLADKDKKLMEALGITKRITFVIDKEGKIVKVFDKMDVNTHPAEVLEFVKTLKK